MLFASATQVRSLSLYVKLINTNVVPLLAFVPKEGVESLDEDSSNECSTVLVVGESMAIAVHNEDANVVLVGHT